MIAKQTLLKAVVEPITSSDWRKLPLDAREGFVLSRIDGTCNVKTLALLVGMSEDEVCAMVHKFVTLGAAQIKEKKSPPSPEKKPRPQEDIDLPEVDQEAIWAMFSQLPSLTHYDVLHLERTVPTGEVKAAYYRFSKDFHPDRFFGRRLGSYKQMLETLFKAGKRAYEILSNTAERMAYDQKLPPPCKTLDDKESTLAADPEAVKRAALEAHRQKILEERKAKTRNPFLDQIDRAKTFADEGEQLVRKGDLVSAMARFALALAYDPLNDHYQRRHADLLPLATEMRVKTLIETANKDAAHGDFAAAARAYRDAFELSPNASFAAHAAEFFFKQGSAPEEQKRLIGLAMEKAPRNGGYQLIHALILEKTGFTAAAREALNRARDLGCDDAEAKRMSKRLR